MLPLSCHMQEQLHDLLLICLSSMVSNCGSRPKVFLTT